MAGRGYNMGMGSGGEKVRAPSKPVPVPVPDLMAVSAPVAERGFGGDRPT